MSSSRLCAQRYWRRVWYLWKYYDTREYTVLICKNDVGPKKKNKQNYKWNTFKKKIVKFRIFSLINEYTYTLTTIYIFRIRHLFHSILILYCLLCYYFTHSYMQYVRIYFYSSQFLCCRIRQPSGICCTRGVYHVKSRRFTLILYMAYLGFCLGEGRGDMNLSRGHWLLYWNHEHNIFLWSAK